MKIIRLFFSEPLGTCECVQYHLPVRIGRHPHNDCQLRDPTISRFHLELDWIGDRLVLRDLGTRNGVHVRVAGEMRRLRGRELTTAAREIEFSIAGIWVRASVEERDAHQIAEAAQESAQDLLDACSPMLVTGDYTSALRVLTALGRGAVVLRGALQAARERLELGASDPYGDIGAALMRWTQASIAAVSFVEEVLEGGPDSE